MSDGSGTAIGVGRSGRVPARAPATSATTTFTYTIEDARRTEAGQRRRHRVRSPSSGGRARRRHRRPPPTTPRPPSRGRCRRPTARRSPTSNCRPNGGAPVVGRGHEQPHAHRASSTAGRTASRCAPQNEAGWGEWSAFSAPVTPDTTPGRPSTPSGRVRRRPAHRDVGRRRPTRARRSPATRSRSAADSTPSSPAARPPPTCGTGCRTARTTSSASSR